MLNKPIAAHYGSGCCHVRFCQALTEGCLPWRKYSLDCVIVLSWGRGCCGLLDQAAVAGEARLPFWIQVVGTGLRAAWRRHLASVCPQATLSSLATHNIWDRDIVDLPDPTAGFPSVSEEPGLGVRVDDDAVELLKCAEPIEVRREITSVVYPNGVRWHFSEQQRHEAFYLGNVPGFVRGVN